MTRAAAAAPRRGLRWFQYAVTLLIVAGLSWFVDWPEVLRELRSVPPHLAAAIVLLVLLERVVLNVKWRSLLRAGGLTLGFWRLLRIQLGANALGTFMPSSIGIDALRLAGLWRFHGRRAQAIAATLLDRVSTVLATMLVGASMLLVAAGGQLGHALPLAVLAVGIAASAFFVSAKGRGLLKACIQRLPGRLRDPMLRVGAAGVQIGADSRAIGVSVVATAVAVLLRVIVGVLLVRACGVEVPFIVLAMVLPAVWGVSMLPISIGGLGVQDLTYVALLNSVGVPPAEALAVSLLDHLLSRVPALLGLFFWRDVLPRSGTDPLMPA